MPAAYTAQQKSAISEFTSVTQSDKTTAAKILRQHNWNVGGAINGSRILPGDKRHALTFLLAPVQQQKSWLGVALQLDPSTLANFEYLRPLARVIRLDCLCVFRNKSVRSVIEAFSLPPARAHFLSAGDSLQEQRSLLNFFFRSLSLQVRVDYYGSLLAGFNRTSYVRMDPVERYRYVEAACVRSGILEEHLHRNYYCEFAPYFNNPNGAANPTRPALSKIFDKYRDNPSEEPDEMNIDGLTELLGEMDIEPGDMGALIFSEIVSSPSLGKVTREGFVDGWSELGVDNLPKMKDVCQQRRLTLSQDMGLFKNVYNAAFPLVLPPGSKTLPLEFATEFWTMLFTPPGLEWKSAKGTPWLEWWLEFQQQIKTKAVNRDLWKQTLNFARETLKDDSLSFWSEESSWPSVIDEFVEWVKTEKRPSENGGSGEAMEVE
ncbi:hypothetical protein KC349_g673 [Hortaea werneckii]|nr:hypothetical protein KC349_g673 [Hortaea werneckii]